jgi:hypothetical protein
MPTSKISSEQEPETELKSKLDSNAKHEPQPKQKKKQIPIPKAEPRERPAANPGSNLVVASTPDSNVNVNLNSVHGPGMSPQRATPRPRPKPQPQPQQEPKKAGGAGRGVRRPSPLAAAGSALPTATNRSATRASTPGKSLAPRQATPTQNPSKAGVQQHNHNNRSMTQGVAISAAGDREDELEKVILNAEKVYMDKLLQEHEEKKQVPTPFYPSC